ncbi:MAG: hydantoinase/oxoprolinase family protein [Nitrospinota bacterium]
MKRHTVKKAPVLRIGVDTGGTFTDFILLDAQEVKVHKVLSTPENPARAILEGLGELLGEARWGRRLELTHGSTVATNALLTRKGSRTALITTEGFEDVLEIGRQNRPYLYRLDVDRPAPLVPGELRLGLRERIAYDGGVLVPLDEASLEGVIGKLKEADVSSVALCLLHSYANPEHERRAEERVKQAGFPVSASYRILPEYREYDRTSTTVLNAYVSPLMGRYLSHLSAELDGASLRIMQSNGGSISARAASEESVRTILSGPAGGVVGAFLTAKAAGFKNVITFDMGGTSTDVSLCHGEIDHTSEAVVGGCPIRVPVIDIQTVGAGGGSLASMDVGGALRVGPESAGADPGPICYGRGETITVTDANLFLGRLDEGAFLGGRMRLKRAPVERAFKELARRLRTSPLSAAEGVIQVANANMERAIRIVSLERGHDPREFTLVSFGGAGGLHACALAEALHIPAVLVPKDPGILSALGMVMADVVKDYSRTLLLYAGEARGRELSRAFSGMLERAREELGAEGFSLGAIRMRRSIDMRYAGQSSEINVPLEGQEFPPERLGKRGSISNEFKGELTARFHKLHERTYGYQDPRRRVQLVTLRVRARGLTKKPRLPRLEGGPRDARGALVGEKEMVFRGRKVRGKVYRRELLRAGNVLTGPALISEFSATTLLPPGFRCRVDPWGNLILTPGKR